VFFKYDDVKSYSRSFELFFNELFCKFVSELKEDKFFDSSGKLEELFCKSVSGLKEDKFSG
jgi:hypothetical protein